MVSVIIEMRLRARTPIHLLSLLLALPGFSLFAWIARLLGLQMLYDDFIKLFRFSAEGLAMVKRFGIYICTYENNRFNYSADTHRSCVEEKCFNWNLFCRQQICVFTYYTQWAFYFVLFVLTPTWDTLNNLFIYFNKFTIIYSAAAQLFMHVPMSLIYHFIYNLY